MDTSSELQEMYEAGLLTLGELLNKLIDLAADLDPASYIPGLPEPLSAAIQDLVQDPPTTVEDVFILGSVTYRAGVDVVAAAAREQERLFRCVHRLHDYFLAGCGSAGA